MNPPRNRKGGAGNPPPKGARASALPDKGYVMRTAAYMVRTGRRLYVHFAKTNFRLHWLYAAMVSPNARASPLPISR